MGNFYPTVQLAYELQFYKYHSIQLDAGYVVDLEENSYRYQHKRGTKLKFEWRYYFEANNRKTGYLSLEPYGNLINFDRTEFKTECFDVACSNLYTRQYSYIVRYRETGVALKFGAQHQYRRWLFDFNYGTSLRKIEYKKPEIPHGFNKRDIFGIFYPNEKKRTVFGVVIGMRVGFLLNRGKINF